MRELNYSLTNKNNIPCAVGFLELRSRRGSGYSHSRGWVNMPRRGSGRPIGLQTHVAKVVGVSWWHLLSGKSIGSQGIKGGLLLRLLRLLLHLMLATRTGGGVGG